MLDYYFERGGNFIDTSDAYNAGDSERIIGKYLKSKGDKFRRKVVIATKFYFPMGDSPNERGCGKKHLLHAVQDSLERLDTRYIDILILHSYDPFVQRNYPKNF